MCDNNFISVFTFITAAVKMNEKEAHNLQINL